MNWWAAVDQYCERLGPDLWAEPLNLLSNLAFLIAGGIILSKLQDWRNERATVISALLAIGVGLGSGVFHLLAVKWTELLDVLFILLFIIWVTICYCRIRLNRPVKWLIAFYALLGSVTVIFLYVLKDLPLNGSNGYAGVLGAILYLGWQDKRISQKPYLFYASLLFPINLILRTLDQQLCPYIPIGTHFLWHLGNGLLLYLAMKSLSHQDTQSVT